MTNVECRMTNVELCRLFIRHSTFDIRHSRFSPSAPRVYRSPAMIIAAVALYAALASTNPFAKESTLPFHAPPFNEIKDSDYQPAIEEGMEEELAEIEAIANDPAKPTFANTVEAMEKSGALLRRDRQRNVCLQFLWHARNRGCRRLRRPPSAAWE